MTLPHWQGQICNTDKILKSYNVLSPLLKLWKSWPLGRVQALRWGQYCQIVKMYLILKNFSFSQQGNFPFSQQGKLNWMHGYDVHYTLFLDCEIHDALCRGSGPWVGPIWPQWKCIKFIFSFKVFWDHLNAL